MYLRRLHLLPGGLFLLVMLTFAATYLIAVFNDHVKPGWPYISDTGTIPPESCIFAQFINIAAFLLMVCVYVRYLQVEEVARTVTVGLLPRKINRVSAYFGYLACLGLDLVANFQETNVIIVHMLGAFICFGCGTIFFIMQTYISRKMMPHVTSSCSFCTRVLASILSIILCVLTVVPGALSLMDYDGDSENYEDRLTWTPEDGGWTMHLISTISEWCLVVCFCTFIASFSGEFYGVTITGPILKLPEPKSFQTV